MSGTIRDGRDVFGVPLDRWATGTIATNAAKVLNVRIPSIEVVATSAPPIYARVDAARWVIGCLLCGTHSNVWQDRPFLWCLGCGNRDIGGHWRTVTMPSDADQDRAEQILHDVPEWERHWDPVRETLDDLATRMRDVRRRYES